MIGRTLTVILMLVLAGSRPAWCDQAKKSDPPALPATTVPAPYLLAGDDVINITVVNFTNLSGQMVVPPDGKISVPLLEPISVIGKTTAEVAQTLTEKWRKYIISPSVSVALVQKRKENVLVYGFVVRPGTAEYRLDRHILEALAEVGGALPQGDLSKVTVTHKTGEKQILDLSHPEKKGGTDQDIILQAGDVAYVPERRTEVSVIGEVTRPGSYDYKDDMTVLDALTVVGGIKDETADLKAATLTHDGVEKKIDLFSLLRNGDISINTKLAAGDQIMIPELKNRTYVFGAVARPGYYLFKPDDRILDALNGTGGPLPEANLRQVNLIKVDKSKNSAVLVKVDLENFLKKGDLKSNALLEPGYVLYVPFRKRTFKIEDIWNVVGGLNLLNVGARILSHGAGN